MRADVVAEALATAARDPLVLPEAWFEPGLAVRMADWITRNTTELTRT